jgi:glutaryl-CoA dehydrogenase
MIRDSARAYAQDKLMARVTDIYATETTEPEIFTKMGLLGTTTRDTYRGLGADFVTYGLVAREGEAVDSGYRSRMSVPDFKRNYSGRLQ